MQARAATRMRLAWASTESAAESLSNTVHHMWAASVTRDRQALWQRYTNYLRDKDLPMTAMTAAWFVESCNVLPTSKLAYAKTLMALFNRMSMTSDMLRLQTAGLRGMGALIPQHQATPIAKADVLTLADSLSPSEGAAILLMWKTASRWDEISRISTDNLLLRTPEEIIVNWSDKTKTSRTDPYRPTMYTVVRGDWTARICRHLPDGPSRPLSTLTYSDLLQRLQRMFPQSSYTGHSFKHGALAAAALAAEQHRLDPTALCLLAKHKTVVSLTNTTIRYLQDNRSAVAVARQLGTGEITTHL